MKDYFPGTPRASAETMALRPPRLAAPYRVVCLLAALWGCASGSADNADKDKSVDAGPSTKAPASFAPDGVIPFCGDKVLPVTRSMAPDVMIVLDRSASMLDRPHFIDAPKWDRMTMALKSTL